jgi:hypothetical protein
MEMMPPSFQLYVTTKSGRVFSLPLSRAASRSVLAADASRVGSKISLYELSGDAKE